MAMSPEQQRKKADAQEESLRHARYAQADGGMKGMNEQPPNSEAIAAAGRRVMAAKDKEDADIGGKDASPNDDRY